MSGLTIAVEHAKLTGALLVATATIGDAAERSNLAGYGEVTFHDGDDNEVTFKLSFAAGEISVELKE